MRNQINNIQTSNPKFINLYTGEVYFNYKQILTTIISDMLHYPACRSIKMLHIKKL